MAGTATETLTPITMPGVQTRLTEAEEQTLIQVLREANTLATGPQGEAFEKEFTAFIGSSDSVCLNSCSSALEMSAMLSGLGKGDEVIMPAHTFVATGVPFARTGATVRWADIDPDSRVISAKTIEPLISPATKVIVVVHLYGMTADMDPIVDLAKKHSIQVVEDCAQAPGARYKNKRAGTIGDFGCFSFHSHKNITTLGEGGILTVRNPDHGVLVRRMRWMGNWPWEGERKHYWKPSMTNLVEPAPGLLPVNYCMGEPNCAVGRLLIKRLDDINAQRQHQASRFMNALSDCEEISFQQAAEGCEHVYHLMAIRVGDGIRDDFMQLLHEKYKLTALAQYWPLNRSELFKKIGFGEADTPITDQYFDNACSFPWYSDMPDDLLDDMAGRVRAALDELKGTV